MNASAGRLGPVLGLLYGATFWGLVWYPSRLLESMGMQGAWLTLVAYATAFVVFSPFVRFSTAGLRQQPGDAVTLVLAAGWTKVAFVLAVLEGEVLRSVASGEWNCRRAPLRPVGPPTCTRPPTGTS